MEFSNSRWIPGFPGVLTMMAVDWGQNSWCYCLQQGYRICWRDETNLSWVEVVPLVVCFVRLDINCMHWLSPLNASQCLANRQRSELWLWFCWYLDDSYGVLSQCPFTSKQVLQFDYIYGSFCCLGRACGGDWRMFVLCDVHVQKVKGIHFVTFSMFSLSLLSKVKILWLHLQEYIHSRDKLKS